MQNPSGFATCHVPWAGNQKVTRFHITMMLEIAKMVLPEHQLP
jgi:hypothetical protein